MTIPNLALQRDSFAELNAKLILIQRLQLADWPGQIGDSVIDYAAQTPNLVFAGPATGTVTDEPTFRALVTADLPDDGVTNAKLRESAAVSVIGRSANSAGNPADIAAASNGQLLMRTSDTIAFSTTIPAAITFTPASGNDAINITAGQLESSSQFGTRLELTSNQSINNTTLTALTNWGESFDRGGCHEGVTNPSRITVPTGGAGIWIFSGGVSWANAAGTYRAIAIRLNGSGLYAYVQVPPASGVSTIIAVSTILSVSDADYVELVVQQDSGAGLNAEGQSYSFFCGMKLF